MRLMYARPGTFQGRERSCFILILILSTAIMTPAVGGPLDRQANTTLQMPSNPPGTGATYQYETVEALNGLSFDKPVFATSPPGDTSRLYVVERAGRIVVITNL